MADLDKFTGILLVSIILSTILFGILTVQTYFYLIRYPDDRNWLKKTVIILWIIDFAHQACVCRTMYHYAINFRHPETLARSTWSLSAFHSLEPILAVVVQLFFARRLHLLNPNWWLFAFAMGVLAVTSFAFGIASSTVTYLLEYWSEFPRYTWLVVIWLVVCATCDILIASGIAYSLFRSRSGFKSTDRLITKLIVWTINTGAFPALFAILELILFLTMSNSFTYMSADIVLAKLYSNSLLAFLNRRKSVMDPPSERTGLGDLHLTTINLNLEDRIIQPISEFPEISPALGKPKYTRWMSVLNWIKLSPRLQRTH